MDSIGNLQQLFQLGQQMQARMSDLQRKLESETLTVTSGGGMVEVTADGKGSVRSIRIDPAVIDPQEVEMLEDLVLAAVSQAQSRARERLEQEMKDATGGLPLPNLASLFGG